MLAICKFYCKIYPKCFKINPKIDTNSFKIHPKSTKMVPRSVPKAILRASRFHVLPPTKFLQPFWSHSGDFGRHLEPQLGVKGSQNQAFWHQVAVKSQKMTSIMMHQKRHEFLIEFWWEKVRFWRCGTLPNALYISISVVFADYDKIENFMKIYAKMDPKNEP